MTVRELIDALSKMPEDLPVFVGISIDEEQVEACSAVEVKADMHQAIITGSHDV